MTGKEIIFSQLKSRFKEIKVKSILLTFDVETGESICKIMDSGNKEFEEKISKMESITIRSMLISKVVKMLDFEVSKITINLIVATEQLNFYATRKDNGELQKIPFSI